MEFPPDKEEWAVFSAADFEAAEVRDSGSLGMELMSQARNNGRIQDHYRIALGGGAILNVTIPFNHLYSSDRYNHLSLRYQVWPRDIVISRNSATSVWKDVTSLIREREVTVINEAEEQIPQEEVLAGLEEEQDPVKKGASIRWAVVVGDDRKMWLQLTALPGGEATINGKPTLQRWDTFVLFIQQIFGFSYKTVDSVNIKQKRDYLQNAEIEIKRRLYKKRRHQINCFKERKNINS